MSNNIDINTPYNTPTNANFYFGISPSGVKQVNIQGDKFVTATTTAGTNIVYLRNPNKTKLYIHNTIESGITSTTINNDFIFIGTTYTGIEYLCTSDLYTEDNDNIDKTYSTINFASYPNITSNYVKYLHCNDKYLMCCTNSGIDCYELTTSGTRYYSYIKNVEKCFITNENAYYTVVSGTFSSVTVIKDFYNQTNEYITFTNDPSSGTLRSDAIITDLYVDYVVSGTSTIYCSTTNGIYAINEDTGNYDLYLTVSG